ncbi:YkgJ family cysteine cluster protein [Pseudomonas sp. 21LCFQ02]|uniref:YkgJ family cysteine cluster protein n=1 Tax=Pseudomonas sp. 21LCFQ02 TaxID=2957505 RepID=UPI0025B7798E|nr:YkgJ family cysteine cluster protein [Pseudomonas sp. 21LCFQ02]
MSDDGLRYNCTACGKCCRGKYVPLTVDEARAWAARGDNVVLMTETISDSLWSGRPGEYQHQTLRAFAASFGDQDAEVITLLVADIVAGCPNLGADNLCTIYEQRPLVCRIYPLEINPTILPSPVGKDCPPEAWGTGEIIWREGKYTDPQAVELIERSRQQDRQDAERKKRLCEALGIHKAGWKNDGILAWHITPEQLLEALSSLDEPNLPSEQPWAVVSNSANLKAHLLAAGLNVTEHINSDAVFHSMH